MSARSFKSSSFNGFMQNPVEGCKYVPMMKVSAYVDYFS